MQHFLVTISNDVNNLFGVRFICSFFNTSAQYRITLLHICHQENSKMADTLGQMWKGPGDGAEGHVSVQAAKSINKAKELLSQHQIAIDQVITKTFAERYGKVKDILTEGSHGLYDAIILGKRASYTLQWMFERPADETIHSILKDSGCTIPLWVCPDPQPERKNVLVCLDGSENGYRAADHVGYILAGQEQQKITLFHVDTGTASRSAEIFSRAEKILHEHGIRDDRIQRTATWGLSVAATIQNEIHKGGYAVAAMGLHGETKNAKTFSLAGSTTIKLISKTEKVSFWCCP